MEALTADEEHHKLEVHSNLFDPLLVPEEKKKFREVFCFLRGVCSQRAEVKSGRSSARSHIYIKRRGDGSDGSAREAAETKSQSMFVHLSNKSESAGGETCLLFNSTWELGVFVVPSSAVILSFLEGSVFVCVPSEEAVTTQHSPPV